MTGATPPTGRPSVRYVVPRTEAAGGIQEFALSQLPHLADAFAVEVERWQSPSKAARVVQAVLPRARSRQAAGAPGDELVHFWHVRAALGRADRRSLITCHGSEIMVAGMPRWERAAIREALHAAGLVVANSEFTRRYLAEHYDLPEARLRVVHPGVAPSTAPRLPRGPVPVLGSLSRLVPRKNIGTVVQALVLLREQHALEFEYLLAGDGPERDTLLAALAASGVPHRYLGRVSDEEKSTTFYPGLDVFVLPTQQTPRDVEGFGIVYLEANAAGVPVVASRNGGVVDAVAEGRSGVFADPHDPADVARAVLEVLADRDGFQARAREWAAQFDAAGQAGKFAALYEELLARR